MPSLNQRPAKRVDFFPLSALAGLFVKDVSVSSASHRTSRLTHFPYGTLK
jgi:hypothetical protein